MTDMTTRAAGPLLAALLALGPVAGLLVSAAPVWAQEQAIDFNIPAQPLARAIAAYGRAASYQISADAGLLRGRTAPSVVGRMSPARALDLLLAGSGVTWRSSGPGRVVLERPAPVQTGASGAFTLDPIVVWASDPADAPFRTGRAVAHISAEEIDLRRGASPGDMFKGTPGVIAASNNNGSKLDVNIRGMQGQNRVKVAIDGTQQTSTTWRGYAGVDERVYLDSDLIGGIDITKGPSDGAAGAGTPGGVVAVRTLSASDIVKDGARQGWRLRLGAGDNAATAPDSTPTSPVYDQRSDAPDLFGSRNASGSLAYGFIGDSVEVMLAYARRSRGNYFAGEHGPTTYSFEGRDYLLSFTKPGEEVFNSSEDSSTLMAKTTFHWGEGQAIEFGYTQHDTEFGEAMGSLLFQQDDGYRQVQLSDITARTYTARYRWQPGNDLVDLAANIWATDVSGTTRAVASSLYFPPYIYPADEPRYSETVTWGADLTNTSRLSLGGRELTLRYGMSWQLEDMDADEYCSRTFTNSSCVWMSPSQGTREIGSLFASGDWQIAPDLTLSAGLRHDAWRLEDKSTGAAPGDDESSGGGLSPSVGLTWELQPGLQLFGRYAKAIRPPTLRETMVSDANAAPNPDLKAETSQSLELGINLLRHDMIADGDSAGLKVSAFRNAHDGYISRVPNPNGGPGLPVYSFANIDKATFTGFELAARYDSSRFFASAAATYYSDYEFCYDAGCQNTSVTYDYAANHLPPELMLSLTLGTRVMEERLTLGTIIDHAGSRMAPLTSQDRMRTAVWEPYTVGTLFASYDLTDSTSLDLRVENVTDRYYVNALDGWTPAPGRTVRLNLSAQF